MIKSATDKTNWETTTMQQLQRGLLLILAPIALALGCASAQATTLLDRSPGADSFSLTPEANSPPEFGRCLKTVGGAYTNAACTSTAEGGSSYEWYAAYGSLAPMEKTGFTAVLKEGTVATLETVGKNVLTCEGESSSGEITGNKSVGNVVTTFTGCGGFGTSCHSTGAAEGTIVMNALEGVLGVEELAAEPINYKIAEKLYPPGHTGPIATFSCAGLSMAVTGAMISPVSSNTMKTTSTVKTKQLKGKQKPENFVGETPEVLMAQLGEGTPEQSGELFTTNQTNAEKVEISSVL
jgi:hypothetical protein